MKAIIFDEYGSPEVLRVKEMAKPVPGKNELLVKISASKIGFGDLLMRNFRKINSKSFSMPLPFYLMTKLALGIRKPKKQILGSDFSGVVESVGERVTKFSVGDAVFGYRSAKFGANAEYICVHEKSTISLKPHILSFEQSSAIPYGALTAFDDFRQLKIKKDQNILVIGAGGSIGSFAVQFGKYYGAEVTGVCGTNRIEYVKFLGADNVIDYKKEDFAENGQKYDIIYDVLNKSSFDKCKNSLTEKGVYVLVSFKMKQVYQMISTLFSKGKKVKCILGVDSQKDLEYIKNLVEEGILKTDIDKVFPMEDAVQAHKYAESGMNKSNVILKIS